MGTYDAAAALSSIDANVVWVLAFFTIAAAATFVYLLQSFNKPAGGSGLVPTLLLTTIGRRSGERRPTPLLYQPTGTGFIIVASRGGSDHHPPWYLNLLANPTFEVQVGRFSYAATARVLSAEERAPYWDRMVRLWPDYRNYQAQTSREIPIVILDAING